MKWLQHSGHRPAQKFTTLHLLRTLPDCKVYKGYKVSTTIHLSTPTTDSKRWVLPPAFQTCCFSTDKNPLPFLFVFQTQSIMQYCQQCSLCRCHIRKEAAFLTVDWRRAINAGLSLVDVSHTLPHVTFVTSIFTIIAPQIIVSITARPHICVRFGFSDRLLAWQMSGNVWTG